MKSTNRFSNNPKKPDSAAFLNPSDALCEEIMPDSEEGDEFSDWSSWDPYEISEDFDNPENLKNMESYHIDSCRAHTCFFTGHRALPEAQKSALLIRLRSVISYLYAKGVTDFHAGGALGFDTLAAMQIIDMKRDHPAMRLILDLPFPGQSRQWTANHKRIYDFILSMADEYHYINEKDPVSHAEVRKCLLMRNCAMVHAGQYCIAYFSGAKGGTGYTLAKAEKYGCEIFNLFAEQAGSSAEQQLSLSESPIHVKK